jgi:hypothetical protein
LIAGAFLFSVDGISDGFYNILIANLKINAELMETPEK